MIQNQPTFDNHSYNYNADVTNTGLYNKDFVLVKHEQVF